MKRGEGKGKVEGMKKGEGTSKRMRKCEGMRMVRG